MSLAQADKNRIRKRVDALLIELGAQLEMGCESSQTVKLDQTLMGRVSRIDAIQQQKIAKAGLERDKVRFLRLTNTARRIDSQEYGYCIECDDDIGLARLLIKPEAEYCVSCQQSIKG